MNILIQIVYFILAAGSCFLDYLMIKAFRVEQHSLWYKYVAEYTEVAELVICFVFLMIGAFLECGLIRTYKSQKDWETIVYIFIYISVPLALIRLFAMTFLCIYVAPGRIDFMGLFLFMVLLYFIMKFGILFGYGQGVTYRMYELDLEPAPKSQFDRRFVPINWLH